MTILMNGLIHVFTQIAIAAPALNGIVVALVGIAVYRAAVK